MDGKLLLSLCLIIFLGSSQISLAQDCPVSVTFSGDLGTYQIDQGLVTGLGGGTPAGGKYSGPGVLDDGNGQTFTFDPSIAGLGISSVNYSIEVINGFEQIGPDLRNLQFPTGIFFANQVDMNADASRVIVASERFDARNIGRVEVFSFDGSNYTQLGSDLSGNNSTTFDAFGKAVAMSPSGNRIAVSALGGILDPKSPRVEVFEWDGSDWVQMGADITPSNAVTFFCMNSNFTLDENRIAISVLDASGEYVQLYDWDGTNWTPFGSPVRGDRGSLRHGFGAAVRLTDNGTRMIVGAPDQSPVPPAIPNDFGYARVYELDGGTWSPLGNKFTGTESMQAYGASVDITPDGRRIAIGTNGSSSTLRLVQVYEWDGSSWVQLGSDVTSVFRAVRLSSDGNRFIASNPFSLGFYDYDGTDWEQIDFIPSSNPSNLARNDHAISRDGRRVFSGRGGTLELAEMFEIDLECSDSQSASISVEEATTDSEPLPSMNSWAYFLMSLLLIGFSLFLIKVNKLV